MRFIGSKFPRNLFSCLAWRVVLMASALFPVANFTHLHAASTIQVLLPGKWSSASSLSVTVLGDYAYVANGFGGLSVVNVRNPSNCVRVGGAGVGGRAEGVAVSGIYAFVAHGVSGLVVVNVSNPAYCAIVGGYNTSGDAKDVAVSGNYAYVADYTNGLEIIDVRDPAHCLRVGGFDTPGHAQRLAVSGNHVYVADSDGGLQVIDVSDPTNCFRAGSYSFYAEDVAVAGGYAYVAARADGLQIIDVRQPTNCVRVGEYIFSYSRDIVSHGVAVSGTLVCVVNGYDGLHIIDATDPGNCLRVGGDNPGGVLRRVSMAAGRIYVAGSFNGMFILPTLTNVQFTVRVEAETNQPFTLEAATDLSAPMPWSPLITTNVPTMPFDYVDFDVKTADKPRKFYRVRQP